MNSAVIVPAIQLFSSRNAGEVTGVRFSTRSACPLLCIEGSVCLRASEGLAAPPKA